MNQVRNEPPTANSNSTATAASTDPAKGQEKERDRAQPHERHDWHESGKGQKDDGHDDVRDHRRRTTDSRSPTHWSPGSIDTTHWAALLLAVRRARPRHDQGEELQTGSVDGADVHRSPRGNGTSEHRLQAR